jgi:hypothetical protein
VTLPPGAPLETPLCIVTVPSSWQTPQSSQHDVASSFGAHVPSPQEGAPDPVVALLAPVECADVAPAMPPDPAEDDVVAMSPPLPLALPLPPAPAPVPAPPPHPLEARPSTPAASPTLHPHAS